jgi:hypothetical protein
MVMTVGRHFVTTSEIIASVGISEYSVHRLSKTSPAAVIPCLRLAAAWKILS